MSGNQEPETVGRHVGYAYVSGNGQLVIDEHPSDAEHLLSPQTRDTQPLYDCRVYLKDLVPKEWLGVRGQFTVRETTSDSGELVEVSIAFERV